jgi:hypothetical protein
VSVTQLQQQTEKLVTELHDFKDQQSEVLQKYFEAVRHCEGTIVNGKPVSVSRLMPAVYFWHG